MNQYTPIFASLVDSSVWAAPLHVRVVWVTMLAVKDRDHVVRMSAFALGRRANVSEKDVLDALKFLAAPDKARLEPQEHEGRRIERVEGGWRVLNGARYQSEMARINRREYKAAWERGRRMKMRVRNPAAGVAAEKWQEAEEKLPAEGPTEAEVEAAVAPTEPEVPAVPPAVDEVTGGAVAVPAVEAPRSVSVYGPQGAPSWATWSEREVGGAGPGGTDGTAR